jgi:predicted phage tail protein
VEAEPLFEQLGKYTMNEVVAYAYNSQTQIELVPDTEGYLTVNGKPIKMDDFVCTIKEHACRGGRMFVLTSPFPHV